MRWWWMWAVLMGLGVAVVSLAMGRDLAEAAGTGLAGFIGGLIGTGVRYWGWLRDPRSGSEEHASP